MERSSTPPPLRVPPSRLRLLAPPNRLPLLALPNRLRHKRNHGKFFAGAHRKFLRRSRRVGLDVMAVASGASDEAFLERYKGAEVFVVSTDKIALTLTGDNDMVYHRRADGFWSDVDGEREGTVLWQGSAFHGHGIRLKPLFVRRNSVWINVFTGKQEVTL